MPVSIQTTMVGPQIPWSTWVPQNKKARPRETKKSQEHAESGPQKGSKIYLQMIYVASFPASSQTNFNTGGVFTTSDRSRHRRSILWAWLKGHTASRCSLLGSRRHIFSGLGQRAKFKCNCLQPQGGGGAGPPPLSSVIPLFIWHATTPGGCLKNRNWDPHHTPLSSFFPQSLKTGNKERFPLFFFLFYPSKRPLFKMEWSSLPKETFPMLKEK